MAKRISLFRRSQNSVPTRFELKEQDDRLRPDSVAVYFWFAGGQRGDADYATPENLMMASFVLSDRGRSRAVWVKGFLCGCDRYWDDDWLYVCFSHGLGKL